MRLRWITLVFCGVLVLGLFPAAAAQMKATHQTVQILYWPASVSGGGSSWTTGYWDLEYGTVKANTPLGYHLHFATGSQSGGPGGTSTFWDVEASYLLGGARDISTRAKLGYGSFGWTAPGAPAGVTSTGFSAGFNAVKTLPVTSSGGGLSLQAAFNWYPSNSSRSSTGSSTGAVTDWTIALLYKFPPRTMAAMLSANDATSTSVSTIQQPIWGDPPASDWGAVLGIRGLTADAGTAASVYNWSGLFFGMSKTF
ncbi:MAG: hypothetical protein AUH31_09805 [Armatimonadetes bacterium 13_1_40CM_64_14]|nr:MAG: hypothetical protein AUH31_09805 [Armatimonadetes bacterium 13_1_40CM_64_14]